MAYQLSDHTVRVVHMLAEYEKGRRKKVDERMQCDKLIDDISDDTITNRRHIL